MAGTVSRIFLFLKGVSFEIPCIFFCFYWQHFAVLHARKPALGSGGFAAVLSLDWLWLCGFIAASFFSSFA